MRCSFRRIYAAGRSLFLPSERPDRTPRIPFMRASLLRSSGAAGRLLQVGVGMTIADHPLHGSGRAALPHPALALGGDGKAHARVGMTDTWRRQPAVDVGAHATPRQVIALTPATQDAPPELGHCRSKRVQRRAVHRDTV